MRDRLSIALTVGVGGASHAVVGGNVRGLELSLTTWGVEGVAEWVVQDDQAVSGKYRDELLADFLEPDLGTVEVTVSPKHWDTSTATTISTIQTRGYIVDRSVRELVYQRQLDQATVLYRFYRVRFVDVAQLLWRQHYPYDLLVQKSFQDLIDAHKGANITITCDWDVMTAQRPQIFVALDRNRGASFHDFVCWLVHHNHGAFTYDHRAGTYAISATKSAEGTATTLAADDAVAMTSVLPEITRCATRLVNSDTQSPVQQVVQNAQAAASIYRDVLLRTAIQQAVDDRATLEGTRTFVPARELWLELTRYPRASILPGDLVDVSGKGGFASGLIASNEPWRVYQLDLRARAPSDTPDQNYGDDATDFEVSLALRLEAKSDPRLRLPELRPPYYPALIEGLVVSDVGESREVTYQFGQDAQTSLDEYRVKVPLFADQLVTTLYEPMHGAGNAYNPLYKEQRVLLALTLDAAEIVRVLDWRSGARAALDGQGHQLLLGKSAESNTTIVHQYADDKPTLQMVRTNQKDTQTLRIKEGNFFIQVKETS